MNSRIKNELQELVAQEVISQDVANDIEGYLESRNEGRPNRLFTVFGVLGAALVGLGVILILAHNWDDFSRMTKTIWAFVPLVIGQAAAAYSIFKEKSATWKEASGVFLFFAVGSSISLVSQIYNIPGDLSSFLWTWILLCVPVIYLLRSRAMAILHLVFATYYVFEHSYSGGSSTPWYYLLFLGALLPFYYRLLIRSPLSNIASVLNWLVPLSMTICLGAFLGSSEGIFGFLMYVIFFGICYNIGRFKFFHGQRIRSNGYLVIGSLGTIVTLLFATFRWFWEEIGEETFTDTQTAIVIGTLFAVALLVLGMSVRRHKEQKVNLFQTVFLIFTGVFLIGMNNMLVPIILVNAMVFALGITTVKIGADRFHFGILNYGLLIVTALVVCRFFDTDMSFVLRGLLFVAVGVGFFLTNYVMLKKQKSKSTK